MLTLMIAPNVFYGTNNDKSDRGAGKQETINSSYISSGLIF